MTTKLYRTAVVDELNSRLSRFAERARDPWNDFDLVKAVGVLSDPMAEPYDDPALARALALANYGRGERGRAVGIPLDVLARDLTTTTSAGGWTVGSPVIAHASAPRGMSVLVDAGVTVLSIDRDAPGVPFVSGTSTASWVSAEGGAVPQSEATFGLRSSSARTVGLVANVSRKLIKQGGPAANALVRRDMLDAVGRTLDAAILAGTGASGQPTGIGALSGTVSMSGTSLSYAALCDGVRQVLAAGARLPELVAVIGSQTFEILSTRERASGSGFIIENGRLDGLGIPAVVSAEAAADSLFIGPWSRVALTVWGPLDIFVNPYLAATSGNVQLRAMMDCDIAVPHPGLFCKATSVT